MKRIIIITVFISLILSACSAASTPNGPMPTYDTGIDTDSWVDIPASEYYQGLNQHLLNLDYDYRIMVTDVTNQQYADFLNQAIADGTLSINDNGIWGFYEGDEFNHERHEVEIPAGDKMLYPIPGSINDIDSMARLIYDGSSLTPLQGYEIQLQWSHGSVQMLIVDITMDDYLLKQNGKKLLVEKKTLAPIHGATRNRLTILPIIMHHMILLRSGLVNAKEIQHL